MSITDQQMHDSHDDHGHHGHYEEGGNHHDTAQEKHRKEHMATWLFIFGDVVFFLLELFFWFYLRANNTAGMWRAMNCTPANGKLGPTDEGLNTCTDGLFNPITHAIPKANPVYTIIVFALIAIAAAFVWFAEVQSRKGATKKTTHPLTALALFFVLAAIAAQFYQFQVLPFTTIQGTYASTFEFYMGSNVAHFLLALVIVTGLWSRSRLGKFDNGKWYQLHLSRLFLVWVAASCVILGLVTIFFA
jgi:heme/copper-type cytochrome/quinol oxidase subunit 3